MRLTNQKREQAAQLIAEDRFVDIKIAEKCGITERTLTNWKNDEEFKTRVAELVDAFSRRALKYALARRERRVTVLNDLHERMLQVIDERAQNPEMVGVPGGITGLIVRNIKSVGKGEDFQLIDVYEVDTALIREIRATQELVAKELGQSVEKRELRIKSLKDLTDDELTALAADLGSEGSSAICSAEGEEPA